MAADLTSLTSVLKEYYVGPLADQLNQDVMVTQMLRVNSQDIEGLKAVVPLHYGRSSGISSRAEGGTIAGAGNQAYTRATFQLKYHYARIQVSGPSISNTRSDRGAFLQAMKSELDFIRNDIQLDQARQYYMGGVSSTTYGVIATLATSAVSGQVFTLTSAEAISKGYLYIGMVIDVLVPNSSTVHSPAGGFTITDVNVTTPSITVSGTVGSTTDGDVIVRSGNVSNTGDVTQTKEVDAGLSLLVRDLPAGGIDPSTTGKSFWKGIKTDVSSAPDINLDDMMVMQNKLVNAGAKASDITVVTTPGLVRRLFQSPDFKDDVRFVNSTTLAGGFESLSFQCGNGPMKIQTDRLAPWGDVLFVDCEQVQVYSPADWDFLARDGLTTRWVADVDAWQSLLFRYVNLGTQRRNTSGVLTGYTDTGF